MLLHRGKHCVGMYPGSPCSLTLFGASENARCTLNDVHPEVAVQIRRRMIMPCLGAGVYSTSAGLKFAKVAKTRPASDMINPLVRSMVS